MTTTFSTKAKLLVLTLAMTVAMVTFAFNANHASAGCYNPVTHEITCFPI